MYACTVMSVMFLHPFRRVALINVIQSQSNRIDRVTRVILIENRIPSDNVDKPAIYCTKD